MATSGQAYAWVNETRALGPGDRELPAMAYDAIDGYTLFFGGGQHRNLVSYSDTWTYRAGVWTQIAPSPSPAGRLGAGLVYDARDHYMLLFGGLNESTGFLNDTWTFSGGHWSELFPSASPSVRWIFGMDYDPTLGEAVLYGGGNFGPLGETWTFSGGNWTLVPTSPTPPWRSDTEMAYDAVDRVSVMYGGYANGTTLGDTWEYSAAGWTQRVLSVSPPARSDVGLAYDPRIPAVVLSSWGSSDPASAPMTWAFSFGTWKNLSGQMRSNFPTRAYQVSAWDGADAYVLQFGGQYLGSGGYPRDTWALDYLNASVAAANLTGEVPFGINVSATYTGGLPPLRLGWSLGGGVGITTANGSLTVDKAGAFQLTFVASDGAGLSVSAGPFDVSAVAPVTVSISKPAATQGVAPFRLNLTATASLGASPYSYAWQFGDGGTGAGSTVSHQYASGGTFSVNVTVLDGFHRSARSTITVVVSSSAPPTSTPSASPAPTPLWWFAAIGLVVIGAVVGAAIWWRRSGRSPPPADPAPTEP